MASPMATTWSLPPTTSSRQVSSERPLRTRPVQKHKRTRDLRPVPIRIRGGGLLRFYYLEAA